MNEYYYEFSKEIDIDQFAKWINTNIGTFHKNLKRTETNTKSLKKWMEMFLNWTEYEENKGDKDGNTY